MSDDVSIEALQDAIRHLHGCESTYLDTVPIVERFQGRIAREGDVKTFALVDHPSGAPKAYAWSFPTKVGRRQFVAVLHAGPVVDARTAVQATIMAEAQKVGA